MIYDLTMKSLNPNQSKARSALNADSLAMISTVASEGSLAAAARKLGLVPSALTYRVRQLEDALDVLLFDRSSRTAKLTAAGAELLREGERVLLDLDSIATRVKRVATGWEPLLTLSVDELVSRTVLYELIEAFYAHTQEANAPTQLRWRSEVLSGTVEALVSGKADLAIGGMGNLDALNKSQCKVLGDVPFVFAVAPHHPLADAAEPLSDEVIQQHRAVAVADTAERLAPTTVGLLPGQEVLTVPTLSSKIEAQLWGLGCGFLPEPAIQRYAQAGQLVIKQVQRPRRVARVHYAWRQPAIGGTGSMGLAMKWWLKALDSRNTRTALLANFGQRFSK
jgi:DNA-binding transcriptional LysR family regulator